jgi:drug/metabolite transporter (DMT)-like permease
MKIDRIGSFQYAIVIIQYSYSNLEAEMQSNSRGYLLAFISTFFLATTAIFIRYLTVNFQIPAFVLAFWRDIFVVVTLFVVLLITNRSLLKATKEELPKYLYYGLVLAGFNIFWTFSVEQNGASVATVLVYTSAAFTAVLGWLLLKESLSIIKILAVIASLMGCVLVSGAYELTMWNQSGFGILMGLASGLGYAVYSLVGRSFANRKVNIWTSLLYTFGCASVYLFIFNFIGGDFLPGTVPTLSGYLWLGDSITGWIVLFSLGAIPTVLGFGLYNASMQYLPSSIANLVATMEPVFTVITAYFLLGEMLNGLQMLGSLIIICAVLMMRIFGVTKQKVPLMVTHEI